MFGPALVRVCGHSSEGAAFFTRSFRSRSPPPPLLSSTYFTRHRARHRARRRGRRARLPLSLSAVHVRVRPASAEQSRLRPQRKSDGNESAAAADDDVDRSVRPSSGSLACRTAAACPVPARVALSDMSVRPSWNGHK